MLENPFYHQEDAKMDRCLLRSAIFRAVLLASVFVASLLYGIKAYAEAFAQANEGGVVVTLYTDKCKLKEVANLAQRAVWQEAGKTFEGCFGLHPSGWMLFYFEDRTVTKIPAGAFKRMSAT